MSKHEPKRQSSLIFSSRPIDKTDILRLRCFHQHFRVKFYPSATTPNLKCRTLTLYILSIWRKVKTFRLPSARILKSHHNSPQFRVANQKKYRNRSFRRILEAKGETDVHLCQAFMNSQFPLSMKQPQKSRRICFHNQSIPNLPPTSSRMQLYCSLHQILRRLSTSKQCLEL